MSHYQKELTYVEHIEKYLAYEKIQHIFDKRLGLFNNAFLYGSNKKNMFDNTITFSSSNLQP